MNVVKCLGLMAGLAALAGLGCAKTASTVRGQSPAAVVGEFEGPIVGTAPGYADHPKMKVKHRDYRYLDKHRNHVLGHEGGWYSNVEAQYDHHRKYVYETGGAGCPACNGGMSCPEGGCPHCGCGCDHGCPRHYHTYQYKWPQNLVYPQSTLPAGFVQYPYYTLRGPTDFFMP